MGHLVAHDEPAAAVDQLEVAWHLAARGLVSDELEPEASAAPLDQKHRDEAGGGAAHAREEELAVWVQGDVGAAWNRPDGSRWRVG